MIYKFNVCVKNKLSSYFYHLLHQGTFYNIILIVLDNSNTLYYYIIMIISWPDKETEKIWNGIFSKKYPRDIQRNARKKLFHIHSAIDLKDLRIPPGNKLQALKGNRKGQFSISINDQWRICFRWKNGSALDVEIVDYH